MKYVRCIIVLSVLIAASCAGLPRPEGPDDSLVIGALVLDFPDGFFNFPAQTIGSHVDIVVENKIRGTKFAVSTTAGGFFSFLSNGADSYTLGSYSYITRQGSGGEYTIKGRLNYDFTPAQRSVNYLGHFTIRYTLPPNPAQQQSHREIKWQYNAEFMRDVRQAEVREYLRTVEPDTPWLSYEFSL